MYVNAMAGQYSMSNPITITKQHVIVCSIIIKSKRRISEQSTINLQSLNHYLCRFHITNITNIR